MNTYAITFRNHTEHEIAKTRSKAKYSFYKSHEIDDSMEFGDFLQSVSCKLVNRFHVKDLFTQNIDQFDHMKKSRGIEYALLGMKVGVNGKPGIIIGYHGLNLLVCLDGNHWGDNCHPWWRMKYFDNKGDLIKEYGD